jgi:hypothetical protein
MITNFKYIVYTFLIILLMKIIILITQITL